MNAIYRHRQTGTVLIFMLAAGTVISLVAGMVSGEWLPALPVAVVLAAAGILFSSLTVKLDSKVLLLSFGPGFIRKSIKLSDMISCRPVTNPWYYGWGIHFIPGGTVYNVSGLKALELERSDGRRYLIGTDEPEILQRAVEPLLNRPASS